MRTRGLPGSSLRWDLGRSRLAPGSRGTVPIPSDTPHRRRPAPVTPLPANRNLTALARVLPCCRTGALPAGGQFSRANCAGSAARRAPRSAAGSSARTARVERSHGRRRYLQDPCFANRERDQSAGP
eukprot:6991039-Prymnesium_polylepis.1